MRHKFQCHDSVLLNPYRSTPRSDATLVYEIVRLLPPDARGDNGYRIKAGAIERAVAEYEIRGA